MIHVINILPRQAFMPHNVCQTKWLGNAKSLLKCWEIGVCHHTASHTQFIFGIFWSGLFNVDLQCRPNEWHELRPWLNRMFVLLVSLVPTSSAIWNTHYPHNQDLIRTSLLKIMTIRCGLNIVDHIKLCTKYVSECLSTWTDRINKQINKQTCEHTRTTRNMSKLVK